MCTTDDPSDSDAVILLSELLKLNRTQSQKYKKYLKKTSVSSCL